MSKFSNTISKAFSKKQFKYGTYAVLLTLAGIAITILLNIGLTVLEDNLDLRADLTQSKKFSLDKKTVSEINNLEKDVYIYPAYTPGNENQDVMELLRKYKNLSAHIKVEVVDPLRNKPFFVPFTKNNETINEGSVIVTDADKKFYRILDESTDLYHINYDENYQATGSSFTAEEAVTRAINYIATGYQPTVYVVEGHGELKMSDVVYATNFFEQNNYTVESVNLTLNRDKAVAGNILVFLAPTADLSDAEYELLKPLMEAGGRFYFLFDPVKIAGKNLPNFSKLFKLYDISLKDGLVYETDISYASSDNPLVIFPEVKSHFVTNVVSQVNLPPVMWNSGAVRLPDVAPESSMTISPLLTSSGESYLKPMSEQGTEKAPGNETGPFVLAAAVEKKAGNGTTDNTRFIISYSAEALTNSMLAQRTSNVPLFVYGTFWMRNAEKEIMIGAKPNSTPMLGFKNDLEMKIVSWLAWLVAPLLLLVAGIVIYLKRKHL